MCIAVVGLECIPHEQCGFKIGALPQQIPHQGVGLEVVPLVISGSIPKSLK